MGRIQGLKAGLYYYSPSSSSLNALTTMVAALFSLQTRSAVRVPRITRKMRHADLDIVISKQKNHKLAFALKEVLMKEQDHIISLRDLSRLRTNLQMKRGKRFAHLIRRYPRLFQLYQDEERELWCCFSKDAEEVVRQEMNLQRGCEEMAVTKLRKLLMMAVDHRLHVPKIAQLRRDLGIPEGFQKKMVYEYPHFFRVVDDPEGSLLELTSWDDGLAVTELEKQVVESRDCSNTLAVTELEKQVEARDCLNRVAVAELEKQEVEARHCLNRVAVGELEKQEVAAKDCLNGPTFKISIPKSITLPIAQRIALTKFQLLPFLSPYSDATCRRTSEPAFEKRNVALIHEILSMTQEKRTTVDYICHFHKEFRLPQNVLKLLLRHPGIFYVSRKDGRLSVFLKEAYNGMNLIKKNEWVCLKERYIELMAPCKNATLDELKAIEKKGDSLEVIEQESSDEELDVSNSSEDDID